MFHVVLFGVLAAMLALFAIYAAGAGQWIIAVPAAVIGAWLVDFARQALRRRSVSKPR